MKNILFILLVFVSLSANAQTDKATTQRIVEAKHFTFVATSAMPMSSTELNSILSSMPGGSGGNINLTGGNYDIRISPDSIITYLPYYGRAFNAPMDQDENGYKFTSTKFAFKSNPRKKGGWDIIIIPQDGKEKVSMNLTVSVSGYASLVVNSSSKQSITYNGYLAEPKKKGI